MLSNSKKRIVVGLSGGIDSSIALVLLKKKGWQPIGLSLKMPVFKNHQEQSKISSDSLEVAQLVCKRIGVPHYVWDVSEEFKNKVLRDFISQLKQSQTPNPCIICNRYLKFAKLFEWAENQKIKTVATGHYCRVRNNKTTGFFELLRGRDKNKDQSYYLCLLPQSWISNLVFPLGTIVSKQLVYQIARRENLNFLIKRKSSQDFCFASGDYLTDFIKKELGNKSGEIKNEENLILGEHQGLAFYTIGQRKGLGLSGGPYFVIGFKVKENALIVTKDQKKLFRKEIYLAPFHFISEKPLKEKIQVTAKLRYRQLLSKATLFPPRAGKLKLIFNQPQKTVTPGQFAAYYQGEVCLGGGRILA